MDIIWQDSCRCCYKAFFNRSFYKGGDMVTEKACAERMLDETSNSTLTRCDSCNRELKSSSEWICSDHRVICNVCYQNMLNPNKKISFEL